MVMPSSQSFILSSWRSGLQKKKRPPAGGQRAKGPIVPGLPAGARGLFFLPPPLREKGGHGESTVSRDAERGRRSDRAQRSASRLHQAEPARAPLRRSLHSRLRRG